MSYESIANVIFSSEAIIIIVLLFIHAELNAIKNILRNREPYKLELLLDIKNLLKNIKLYLEK